MNQKYKLYIHMIGDDLLSLKRHGIDINHQVREDILVNCRKGFASLIVNEGKKVHIFPAAQIRSIHIEEVGEEDKDKSTSKDISSK